MSRSSPVRESRATTRCLGPIRVRSSIRTSKGLVSWAWAIDTDAPKADSSARTWMDHMNREVLLQRQGAVPPSPVPLQRRPHVLVEEHERLPPAHYANEGVVDLGVEDGSGEIRHPLHRLFGCHLFLIGARRGEGVIHLGRRDHASAERDFFATLAIGIAGAIDALMMALDHRNDVSQVHQRREDLRADDDVLFDVLELFRGEWPF